MKLTALSCTRAIYVILLVALAVVCGAVNPVYWAQGAGSVLAQAELVRQAPVENFQLITVAEDGAVPDARQVGGETPAWGPAWAFLTGNAAKIFGSFGYRLLNVLALAALMLALYRLFRVSGTTVCRPEQGVLLALFTFPLFFYSLLYNPLILFVALAAGLTVWWKRPAESLRWAIAGGLFSGLLAASGGMLLAFAVAWAAATAAASTQKSVKWALLLPVSAGVIWWFTRGFLDGKTMIPVIAAASGQMPADAVFNWLWNAGFGFSSGGTGVPGAVYMLLLLPFAGALAVGVFGRDFCSFRMVKTFLLLAATFSCGQLLIWMYRNPVPELNMIYTQGIFTANPITLGLLMNLRPWLREKGAWKTFALLAVAALLITPWVCPVDYPLMFGSWRFAMLMPLLVLLGLEGIVRTFSGYWRLTALALLVIAALAIQFHGLKMLYKLDAAASELNRRAVAEAADADVVLTDAFYIPELTPGLLGKPVWRIDGSVGSSQLSRLLEGNPGIRVLVIRTLNRDYGFLWRLGMEPMDDMLEFPGTAPSWGVNFSMYPAKEASK